MAHLRTNVLKTKIAKRKVKGKLSVAASRTLPQIDEYETFSLIQVELRD